MKKLRKLLQLTGIAICSAVISFSLGVFVFGSIYKLQHRGDKADIGASFSAAAARGLGSDWQANFVALLDDLKFRSFRLTSYWGEVEATPGVYDFSDLDWQFAEAEKRGAKISLAVGLRQPRWPECHQPGWAKELYLADKNAWQSKLLDYISEVVKRYRSSPSLESWHLENEYYNRSFGECDDFSTKRLSTEVALVKKLDASHPLILALADQYGFPFTEPTPDIFATSVYRGHYDKYIGYFTYPIPTHFYSAKAFFIKLLRGRETFIHELQLEPWGPNNISDQTVKQQDEYMPVERIKSNIEYGLSTGMKKINLWGSEWWYWRKVQFNDPTVWDTVKSEVDKY